MRPVEKIRKKHFLIGICALCLNGALAVGGCSNPIYNTPGALDPDDIIAIAVTPPTKRLYRRGESLDLTGALVHIYYRGPGVAPKLDQPISPAHVSGFDSKREGIQTITVTTGNQSDRFDIALIALPEAVITASTGSIRTIPLGELEGSWRLYVFDEHDTVLENHKGSGSTVSFQAPFAPAVYTVALVVRKDGYAYTRFYKLTVEE
ncbi:MAG: bacterial Ig-like domain-containing protein [Treponema sp.]|jgi:hypothetical protein|nr:bacterial Ig-like domain-containing protein [Treponema sp.]